MIPFRIVVVLAATLMPADERGTHSTGHLVLCSPYCRKINGGESGILIAILMCFKKTHADMQWNEV